LHHSISDGGRGDVAEGGRFDIRARVAEFRIVPDVEGFDAEGEPHPLLDREDLEDRHVSVEQVRPTQNVAARVAVGEDALRDVAGDGEGRSIDATDQVPGAAVVHRRLQQVGTLRTCALVLPASVFIERLKCFMREKPEYSAETS
jgi:hypothetical protein